MHIIIIAADNFDLLTNLNFIEARDCEWQWHQLGHMQVYTSLQTDNNASTPPLILYRPDALPAIQPCQSTIQFTQTHARTHTHTHTHPFNNNGPFSRTTRMSRYQKGKPIWILLKQQTVSGSGISWAICKSAPCSNQTTTPAPHHSVFYRPDALPAAQPTASKH